jgi:hypothetical protein
MEQPLQKVKRKGRPALGEVRFDLCRAVDLRLKGMSIAEIAKFLHVQQNTVSYHFSKLFTLFNGDPEVLKLYERSRGDFLKRLQMTVGVEVFDPAKLKKSSINNLAYAFKNFYDCERLEAGKSTQNIAYADVVRAMNQEKMTLDKLKSIHKQRHSVEDSENGIEDQGEVVN